MKCARDCVVTFLNIACWTLLSRRAVSKGPAKEHAIQTRQDVCLSWSGAWGTLKTQGVSGGMHGAELCHLLRMGTHDEVKPRVTPVEAPALG